MVPLPEGYNVMVLNVDAVAKKKKKLSWMLMAELNNKNMSCVTLLLSNK